MLFTVFESNPMPVLTVGHNSITLHTHIHSLCQQPLTYNHYNKQVQSFSSRVQDTVLESDKMPVLATAWLSNTTNFTHILAVLVDRIQLAIISIDFFTIVIVSI